MVLIIRWRYSYNRPSITVFDAILTSRQSSQTYQCLYGNLMADNFLFHSYWGVPTKIIANKIRNDSQCNQSWKLLNIVHPIRNANEISLLMMKEHTEENVTCESRCTKNPHALKNGRGNAWFCLLSWRIYLRARKEKGSLKKPSEMSKAFIELDWVTLIITKHGLMTLT